MRKVLKGLLLLLVGAAVAFFVFAPGYVEERTNMIDGEPLIAVSDEAKALHATLTIVDLHSDTLLWKRSLLERADRGHMDLPRLEEGNVALQIFSSVTKSPDDQNYDSNPSDTDQITELVMAQLQPTKTWNSLLERTLWHARRLEKAAQESEGSLVTVRSAQDLDDLLESRRTGEGPVGGLFSAEGLHSLEGDIANLDTVYAAGMRMAGLTHFFDNELAGSMHGEAKGGLTEMGRAVVRRMEEMGMVVDIAHCSHACVADILAMARRPVVSSHGGVQQPRRRAGDLQGQPQPHRRGDSRSRGDRRSDRHRLLGCRDLLDRCARCGESDEACARPCRDRICRVGQRLRRRDHGALRHLAAHPSDAGADGRRLQRSGNPRSNGRQRSAGAARRPETHGPASGAC